MQNHRHREIRPCADAPLCGTALDIGNTNCGSGKVLEVGASEQFMVDSSGNLTRPSVTVTGTGSSISTKMASNTDLAGELAFSAATTATYTWAGTYTSHPEVVITPQATTATAANPWVTYTGVTSFTINFPSAFTGNGSCIAIASN
jgi:hypothetical protein